MRTKEEILPVLPETPEQEDEYRKVNQQLQQTMLENIKLDLLKYGVPVGVTMAWSVLNDIPDGWMERDGSPISRTTYAELFAIFNAAGLPYGSGDGSTTFNIPDDATAGDFLRHYKSGVSEAIGTHQGDQFQGFFIEFERRNDSTGHVSGNYFASHGGGTISSRAKAPITDGVNGVPRTGSESRSVNNAVIFILKCR